MQKKQEEKPKPKKGQPNSALKYTGIATKMAAIIIIGSFGGVELDKRFSTQIPIYTLTLTILSVAFAMYVVIKDISKP